MDGLNYPKVDVDFSVRRTVEPRVVPAVKKIAILGSASSSLDLAPWTDDSWTIWGCSGATQPRAKRYDVWFELHHMDSCRPLWTKEYIEFLQKSTKPVYMIEKSEEFPSAIEFPRDELVAKFGRYFFTSSIAWMLALAIHQDAKAIGLYGVDMAADSEYYDQRPACHHFISMALHQGIEVTIPPESSLLNPPPMYGCAPRNPLTVQAISLSKRVKEHQAEAQQRYENAVRDVKYWEGFNAANTHWMKALEQDPKSLMGGDF